MRPHAPSCLLAIGIATAILFAVLPVSTAQREPQLSFHEKLAPAASIRQPPPANSQFEGTLSSILNSKADLGDYIPCEFTVEQLRNLRPSPAPDYLTAYEAEELKKNIIAAALSSENRGIFHEGNGDSFSKEIANATLEGRTRSEALVAVIQILQGHQTQALLTTVQSNVPPNGLSAFAQYKSSVASINNKLSPADAAQRFNELSANWISDVRKDTTINAEQRESIVDAIHADQSKIQQVREDQTKSAQAIVDTARTTISALSRPPDVGCAMAILSWHETRYAFGPLVAGEYIGVQVVVRNLNENKQFLVQDGELAVNADLNGRLGRFYSGRDQKIVRQLSVAQQAYSFRNLFVNVAGAIGTLANAAMPFAGPSFKDATGVYNSGFVTGLTKSWPDYTLSQLNLLNDVGFSASTDAKAVLVPKSGAVMFVMFVPSKQFERGWWTQSCVKEIVPTSSGPSSSQEQFGIDVSAALNACGSRTKDFKSVRYKHWSASADAIFRELAFTVVAGTHIAQESKTTPAIAKMDCPRDGAGNVDFGQQSGGSVICTLTGTNLDKVSKLKLRNSADATDNTTADGSVTISGDTTTAKADLPLSQIGPLEKPDYKVYTITKDGIEEDAKQVLHFALTPFLVDLKADSKANPKTIDLSLGKPSVTITLTGYHLDKLGKEDKVHLSNASGTSQEFDIVAKNTLTASFDVAPSDRSITGDNQVEVWLFSNGKPIPPESKNKPTLTVSGTFPGLVPPKLPQTKKPEPVKKPPSGKKPKGAAKRGRG